MRTKKFSSIYLSSGKALAYRNMANNSNDVVLYSSDTMNAVLILCMVFNVILIAASVWILISMIVFGQRTKKWKTCADKTNLDGGKVYVACVVTVAWTLPKYVLTQLLFHPDILTQCEWIIDGMVVVFYVVLWQIYFFLWLRHRAIYAHPTVKDLMGRYSNEVSWTMLILLSALSVGVLCEFTVSESYGMGPYGCIINRPSNHTEFLSMWDAGANYILGIFLVISQISFLSLFVYPMILTKQMRSQESEKDAESRSTEGEIGGMRPKRPTIRRKTISSLVKADKRDNITKTIRRSVVASALAVCSDIAAALSVALIPESIPRAITVTIYDISLMISIFCVMATFGNIKKILFVFFRPRLSRASSEKSLPRSRTASTEVFE